MTRPLLLSLAFTLSLLALGSCGEYTSPTTPDAGGDESPTARSLRLPSDSWTAKAPPGGLYDVRFGLAAGATKNSSAVYVFGGHYDEFLASSIRAYDLATDTWTTKAAEFTGTHPNGVGEIDGKLYISGGYLRDINLASLYAYDPAADRSSRMADMPRPTAEGVSGVINGKLYVLSGVCNDDTPPEFDCDEGRYLTPFLYRFDPAMNAWTTLASAPHTHARGVGGVIHGKFYVAGGSSGNTLDAYDPRTNSWKTLASMPAPRYTAAGAVMKNELWVIGANGSDRITYAYDPRTDTWKTRAPLPPGGASEAAATLKFRGQSHILVVGGNNGVDYGHPAASELYTP